MHRFLSRPIHHSTAIAFLGIAMVIVGMVTADAGPVAGNTKIAFINLESTLLQTPVGKRAQKQFEQALKKRQGELDKKQEGFQQQLEQLEKQKSVITPDAYKKRRQELEQQYVEVQKLYMKLEKELAGERAKLIQDILKKAEPVIIDIAKQEGISMIFDRQAVLWADDGRGLDLTDRVNARMN